MSAPENGPGAVVPVGWLWATDETLPNARWMAYPVRQWYTPDPSHYTPAILERGTPILPEEARPGDQFLAPTPSCADAWWIWDGKEEQGPAWRNEHAWLRPHAAPPQESDKGRCCGRTYHDKRGDVQDCEDGTICRRCLERQLAEARAEVEALREEVEMTNEHEHQILQERNEARDELQTARAALLAYQEAEPVAWYVGRLDGGFHFVDFEKAKFVASCYDAEPSPLYDRPAPADVVTVPREEWEALRELFAAVGRTIHTASTGGRATLEEINEAWAGVCSAQIALRSSAQAGGDAP